MRCCRGTLATLLLGLATLGARAMPPEVDAALQRARVPHDALSVLLQEAGTGRTVLAHNANIPVNPASLAKLLTTLAALDQLGPAWTWSTPVWLQGSVNDGVLDGSLVIKGSGDPKLVVERVWLMLRRVQQLGVREIRGDIVLDRSAFAPSQADSADFDGDPTRPYNVQPDALLLNFKSVTYGFVPDAARGVAQVLVEPPLAGTQVERTVRLSAGPCDDWRTALKASFAIALRVRFAGSYPAACGELNWPVADADPASYNARLIEALWRDMGNKLAGRVVDGAAPQGLKPSFELKSPPLADIVRDINKYSNNVMAQQVYLTLGNESAPATAERARQRIADWLNARGLRFAELEIENGSGLSRSERISADSLNRLLLDAWRNPVMPEFVSSLPIVGIDGTMKKRLNGSEATGRAHIKTGTLDSVKTAAGYALDARGRRYAVTFLINHPRASAGSAAIDALLVWVAQRRAGEKSPVLEDE
jgi:D-alanyl-D-alanine carboxypeptidase/D-alanyl-D-alanine-endopeptidase (penicillin-binding protein 4)